MKDKICILFLALLFCQNLSSQNDNDTFVMTLPKSIKSKVYKKFKIRQSDKTIIINLSSVENEKYSGVYTFQLSYQPHYPTKMFLLFKKEPYALHNLGFENPIGVIKETCQYLSTKKYNEAYINSVLMGLYLYVYGEYGLDYGRHLNLNSKPIFNNDNEKNIYIRSHIRDFESLKNNAQRNAQNKNKLPESIINYIDERELNEEEAIEYLRIILETIYVDYQNTNDPVLFWFDVNLGRGELQNANIKIREKSNESTMHIHRSPIDMGDFWKTIEESMKNSFKNLK